MHRPLFPREEEALATRGQSEVPLGLGPEPGVQLIETATCPRDGRKRILRARLAAAPKSNGRGRNACRNGQSDPRRDVLGCSRNRKERLDNLENEDRDNPTSNPNPPTQRCVPVGRSCPQPPRSGCAPKNARSHLTRKTLSGKWHPTCKVEVADHGDPVSTDRKRSLSSVSRNPGPSTIVARNAHFRPIGSSPPADSMTASR